MYFNLPTLHGFILWLLIAAIIYCIYKLFILVRKMVLMLVGYTPIKTKGLLPKAIIYFVCAMVGLVILYFAIT